MVLLRFRIGGDSATFNAVARGPDWNGWLVPIVDRHTLEALVERLNAIDDERTVEIADYSAGVTLYEFEWPEEVRELVNEATIQADADGNYLLNLGLTLVAMCE